MVSIEYPKNEGDRITYHLKEREENFTSIYPPIKENYGDPYTKGNRKFFENYRKNVLSKYTAPMYKWGEVYDPYSPHPKLGCLGQKQIWTEMFSYPYNKITFKDEMKVKEIEAFYLLCQYQRAYYNDYTGNLHPMDYFQRDEYRWHPPPGINSTYVQIPETFIKHKHPYVLPLTTARAWIEPFEPCRRMAGKRDPYPDLSFVR